MGQGQGRICKGPRAGTQTQDDQSATVLYDRALPATKIKVNFLISHLKSQSQFLSANHAALLYIFPII